MTPRPLDTCNIEELVHLTPFALVYVFRTALGLCVTTVYGTTACSAKTLLAAAVYLTGLTVLEHKQNQSEYLHKDQETK
jgi:hypothetical protein